GRRRGARRAPRRGGRRLRRAPYGRRPRAGRRHRVGTSPDGELQGPQVREDPRRPSHERSRQDHEGRAARELPPGGASIITAPKWQVGDVTITAVAERHNEVPAADFIPAATGISELHFVIQAICLEVGDLRIVVDTCIGARPLPDYYAGLANDGSF